MKKKFNREEVERIGIYGGNGEERLDSATGKMVRGRRNFAKPVIESNLPKDAQISNLIAAMPTEMVKELSKVKNGDEERLDPTTGKMARGRRNFAKPVIESNLPKDAQISNLIAAMPTEMVKELSKVKNGEAILKSYSEYSEKMTSDPKAKRLLDILDIEMSKNGDKIPYGMDEIGLIYDLYGKDSEIYNAMAEGKVVSGMIEESMNKNKEAGKNEIANREESLLARCLKREKGKGLGV